MENSNKRYDAGYWLNEIQRYKKDFEKFTSSGQKVIDRYMDCRKDAESSKSKFNILYSNTRTLKPAVYSKPPKPEVSRRFKDADPIARTACQILERAIEYEITQFGDFHCSVDESVEDMLLPGRGTAWVRYEPTIETIETEPMITEDVEVGGESYAEGGELDSEQNGLAGEEPEPLEMVADEHTPCDYVHWRDFAHSPARTWEEVTWVARRVFLDKEEGEARFGEMFGTVSLVNAPEGDKGHSDYLDMHKKASVWEIWCKSTENVYWVAEGFDKMLDEREDPLGLEDFFPCPKPLYSCVSTESLIPAPLFRFYQDQADELDDITARIVHLTKAMKVMGVYAADEESLSRLMEEGDDATLIPVTNWQQFAEKGGIQGAVQLIPLAQIVGALQQLYASREACKQTIYEITGMSDIIRGASVAAESATAQQIKAQFASVRLNDIRDDVARFARDLIRIKAEIICKKYQPETLIKASGIMKTPDAQLAWPAIQLLRNDSLRDFAIDIDTDQLVQIDEQQEKQSRMEFLATAGGFLEKAVQASQVAPDIVPLVMQMMMFGIRGWKIGRELESSFEQASDQIMQKLATAQQQPAQKSPEQIKQEAETERRNSENQTQLQQDQLKVQGQLMAENMKQQGQTQRDRERASVDLAIASMKNPTPADVIIADVNQIERGL